MSEQNNNQAYTAKVQKYVENGTPFVPFLGVFLTQVSLNNNKYFNKYIIIIIIIVVIIIIIIIIKNKGISEYWDIVCQGNYLQ